MELEFDQNQAMEEWAHISKAINRIFAGSSAKISYNSLYSKVFDLTINRFSPRIYDLLEESIKLNIKKLVSTLAEQTNGDPFLTVHKIWSKIKTAINQIKDIFLYMEQKYVV